jgi:histidine triad (HIT) family protein
MKNDNCIFCKIANGEIPSRTVYEDDSFRVILDNGPATKGHALVLPKDHYADLFEIPEDVAAAAIVTAKKAAALLKEKLHADGLNIVQNNGEAAGQSVFHLHIHVIPRFVGDTVSIGWKPGEMPSDMAETAEAIRANLEV